VGDPLALIAGERLGVEERHREVEALGLPLRERWGEAEQLKERVGA
jgi:hypothetical protein